MEIKPKIDPKNYKTTVGVYSLNMMMMVLFCGFFCFLVFQITQLQSSITATLAEKKDSTIAKTALTMAPYLAPVRVPPSIKARRILKGHFGKINALHWGGDSQTIVSASQDGNLLLWNAVTANKLQSISLKSSYVMAVGIEQTKGNLVACGGLDNLCTIYRTGTGAAANHSPPVEMASHDGFLSCCRFLSEDLILTSSGDSTCLLWNIAGGTGRVVNTFAEHQADAMFLAIRPNDLNSFLSCSVDRTIKLWDIRTPTSSKQTFTGHEGDVNGVDFLPSDNNAFATCSEDGTVRLWDIRAYQEVSKFGSLKHINNDPMGDTTTATYTPTTTTTTTATGTMASANTTTTTTTPSTTTTTNGFTSIACSKSGRLIFCGHGNGNVMVYDVLSDRTTTPAFTINQAHDGHVSCVGIAPDGNALCTGSWDFMLKIWA
jgi:guanine nucleotide-binding protein G(I)/G(S)/G(T) subunit beta-1